MTHLHIAPLLSNAVLLLCLTGTDGDGLHNQERRMGWRTFRTPHLHEFNPTGTGRPSLSKWRVETLLSLHISLAVREKVLIHRRELAFFITAYNKRGSRDRLNHKFSLLPVFCRTGKCSDDLQLKIMPSGNPNAWQWQNIKSWSPHLSAKYYTCSQCFHRTK